MRCGLALAAKAGMKDDPKDKDYNENYKQLKAYETKAETIRKNKKGKYYAQVCLQRNKVTVNKRGTGDEQYPPEIMLALLVYSYATGRAVKGKRFFEKNRNSSVPKRQNYRDVI